MLSAHKDKELQGIWLRYEQSLGNRCMFFHPPTPVPNVFGRDNSSHTLMYD